MAKKMLIDATHPEETRVVVVDGNKVEEFDFESENKRQLAGNIYLAKVTRVEPSLQAAFVDYGGNRHGFLAFSEIHPDYYQIPVADREALLAEERAYAASLRDDDDSDGGGSSSSKSGSSSRNRSRRSRSSKSENKPTEAAVAAPESSETPTAPVADSDEKTIPGMDVVDFDPTDDPLFTPIEDTVVSLKTETGTDASESEGATETSEPSADASVETTEPAQVEDTPEAVSEPDASVDAAETVQPEPVDDVAPEAVETPYANDSDDGGPKVIPASGPSDHITYDDPDPEGERENGDTSESDVTSETKETASSEDTDESTVLETAPATGDSEPSEEAVAEEAVSEDATAAEPVAEAASEPAAETEEVAEADTSEDGEDEAPEIENPVEEAEQDDTIEDVGADDTEEEVQEVRQPRKPRPRRYKIQEVIKVRQIMLVQVVKEERGNKGAALTTYLSLAGRYCVLMPNTARGGGISRKITNATDRKKLKEIATEMDVPEGAGLIIRTAGAKRTKSEIKRDYEYLQRLWEQIRQLALKSYAPAKIYEEGDLIKRSIRDLYNREIDEVFVEGDAGYRTAKDFMKMIMPSHAKNVKQYTDPLPLFARHQVEGYLDAMFNPVVKLKSGGYIVIGVTEALVAIDVNSGKATKEGSIEQTAVATNLEAADEIARQLRLRDLAGLIVIDFIDMEERKNNSAVEKRFKDRLKNDRARIQVGRISGFGLFELSRQRLRPGMIEATTQPCPHCHGTGLIRSDDSMALSILRALEEEGVRRRSREVLVKAPIGIANYLMNHKRSHIAQIEARYGLSVRLEADPSLVSPDYTVERFKTATRTIPAAPVISVDTSDMAEVVEEPEAEAEEAQEAETPQESTSEVETQPKKRRRRRRRRKGGNPNGDGAASTDSAETGSDETTSDTDESGSTDVDSNVVTAEAPVSEGTDATAESAQEAVSEILPAEDPEVAVEGEPVSEAVVPADGEQPEVVADPEPEAVADAEPEETAADETVAETEPEPLPEVVAEPEPEPVMAEAVHVEPPKPEEPPKPKRRGWWSVGE
ncbi:MAG: Rne/Rng family ribonuclease [Pseudomonadota bacterium]